MAVGLGSAVLESSHGKFWIVALDGIFSSASPQIVSGQISLGPKDGVLEYCDVAGSKILVACERAGRDTLEVHDFSGDAAVFATQDPLCGAISPDGKNLILFANKGISRVNLDRPDADQDWIPLTSDDGPAFDSPSNAMIVGTPDDPATLTVAVGDYGFALVTELSLDLAHRTLRFSSPLRTFSQGLVYDPVDVVDVVPGRWLVVRHGHGAGLTRFDLSTDAHADCPLPAKAPEPRYGAFRRVVTQFGSPRLWVDTDVGPYCWEANGTLMELDENVGEVIAIDGENFIGLSQDGRVLMRGTF